jgi:copper resistance protein B
VSRCIRHDFAIRPHAAFIVGAALLLDVSPVGAQPAGQGNDAEMEMGSMQGGSAPPDARDPHEYSEGVDFTMGTSRPELADVQSFSAVLLDNLEVMRVDGKTSIRYDLEAWFGRTYDRAVLKAEGEIESGEIAEGRTELLWGHAVAPYWDAQLGLRHDSGEGPNRSWLAFGVEGLAPYWFELEITGYLGESSRSALRVDASYDMPITQRLVLQPRIEANFYGKDDIARGLGSGLSDISAALRLRYEFRRELAPYLGIERVNQHGETEDFTRAANGDPGDTRVVAGIRFWF